MSLTTGPREPRSTSEFCLGDIGDVRPHHGHHCLLDISYPLVNKHSYVSLPEGTRGYYLATVYLLCLTWEWDMIFPLEGEGALRSTMHLNVKTNVKTSVLHGFDP